MIEKKIKQHSNDLLYALDIGTRNVVGLVMRKTVDDTVEVIGFEMREHPDRAMYDGQIHDIEKVARTVHKVTQALEEKLSCKLKQVAIAAAGRALKTDKVKVTRAIDGTEQITKAMLDAIEMEGIQQAQMKLETIKEKQEPKYYCVGYSVMQYELDNAMILNPVGHRGDTLTMEIIATFLPHIVVDSLYTVVDQVGLEVLSMTLEPIAAIQVAIPQKFRLLNLALIDVGAGTSDIALTRNGTVFSYGMVAVAGDELTEALSTTYLLDFETAEKLKMALLHSETVCFKDIVGMEHTLPKEEVVTALRPTMERITKQIADKVLEYNEKPPSAVFCIGGGCQVPGFTEMLSEALKIPRERTVIKSTDSLENIEFLCPFDSGPEFITPVGIGYAAFKDKDQDFISVTVNDKNIRLLNARPLNVSDALILIGYPARRLLPEKGKGLKVTVDGKEKVFQGEAGIPAQILLNGSPVGLDHFIKHKDMIKVEAALKGSDAFVKLEELHELQLAVTIDRKPYKLLSEVWVNGEKTDDLSIQLKANDKITCLYVTTLEELIDKHGLQRNAAYTKDQEPLPLQALISPNDTLSILKKQAPSNMNAIKTPPVVETQVTVQEAFWVTVNGKRVEFKGNKTRYIFVDVFDYYAFDRSRPQGILKLEINGKKAAFHEPLNCGDYLEIGWVANS